jgi:hypothetical protein
MKALIVLIVSFALVVLILRFLDKKFNAGFLLRWVLMRLKPKEGVFPFKEIREDSLPTAVCVDLGAFRKPLPNLSILGVKIVVVMEDRRPRVFLGHNGYKPEEIMPLNRHKGPAHDYKTQADLRELVQELHKQGIKVLIGFWGFWADGLSSKPSPWLQKHPELAPRIRGECDIGNPFAILKKEGISFAEYIAEQYRKLHHDFGFDGLFLGDGLCGFRDFMHLEKYAYLDDSGLEDLWAVFYHIIAKTVHDLGGELWAYDCMGFSLLAALSHGVSYGLLSKAGLDVLVFQTYPTAWGRRYFKVSGKTGLSKDFANFLSVKSAIRESTTRLFYSLEMGDSREGWRPSWECTRTQMNVFRDYADGKLIVWGNELVASLSARQ